MSTSFNLRTLKISSQLVKYIANKAILKPKITITGDWLEKAGFEIGENITISVSNNLLIIQKINTNE
jgi:toxic protein SymE